MCQMKDWKNHQRECSNINSLLELPPEARDDIMLVGRVINAKKNPIQSVLFGFI